MVVLRNIWKYSKLRFYYLNFVWNLSFWLFCKKIYKNVTYNIDSDDFFMDDILRMNYVKQQETKRRFVGYMYKNQLFLDNPGLSIQEREVWEHWRKKGLV